MFCVKCGNEIGEARFCSKCGAAKEVNQAQGEIAATATIVNNPAFANSYPGVSEKYRTKFAQIDAAGGSFAVGWNWWAFFCGVFWYFAQGLWGKALIAIIGSFATGGILGLAFCIYAGLCGDYDYYLLKTKNKQLW